MTASFKEKRMTARSRVFFGGEIRVGAEQPIECHVKNISSAGASIVTLGGEPLPDRFELFIRRTNERRHAVVAWSRGPQRGVAYRPPVDRSWASPPKLRLVPMTPPDA